MTTATLNKKARIRKGVCGSGDKMISSLIEGERIPKTHKVLMIYSGQESFSNALQMFYCKHGHSLQTEDKYMVEWLIENLNNLGAFAFGKGKYEHYAFPIEVLEYLECRIKSFEEELEDCQDFMSFQHEKYILLDKARIEARNLERAYAIWYEFCEGRRSPTGVFLTMSQILNRLSTYIWNLIRYEMKKDGVPEKHWVGDVTQFDPNVGGVRQFNPPTTSKERLHIVEFEEVIEEVNC